MLADIFAVLYSFDFLLDRSLLVELASNSSLETCGKSALNTSDSFPPFFLSFPQINNLQQYPEFIQQI